MTRNKIVWFVTSIIFLWPTRGWASDVEWTRLRGTVKGINLKAQTVTLENRDGDLITVPVDYQVAIEEKHGELRGLRTLHLDERVILTRTPAERPHDETEGLVPPEQTGRPGSAR